VWRDSDVHPLRLNRRAQSEVERIERQLATLWAFGCAASARAERREPSLQAPGFRYPWHPRCRSRAGITRVLAFRASSRERSAWPHPTWVISTDRIGPLKATTHKTTVSANLKGARRTGAFDAWHRLKALRSAW